MNRRGFLGGLLVALAAPSIVRAGSIMPVRVPLFIPRDPYRISITPSGQTLEVGDVISFSGFERVHRTLGHREGRDRQFVVTAVCPSGSATLSVYPPMTPDIVTIPRIRMPPAPALIAKRALIAPTTGLLAA